MCRAFVQWITNTWMNRLTEGLEIFFFRVGGMDRYGQDKKKISLLDLFETTLIDFKTVNLRT